MMKGWFVIVEDFVMHEHNAIDMLRLTSNPEILS